MNNIEVNDVVAMIFLIACIFVIPIIIKKRKGKKFFEEVNNNNNNYKNKVTFKVAVVIFLLIFLGCVLSFIVNSQVYMVLDVNQFYKQDKSTTITQEELIELKGQPVSIEEWNYEINESKSFPITSLYYDNCEEYSFYNDHLVWILITRDINFSNKYNILSMFGLKQTDNTKKVVDNNYTLRYKNCGVADFWIANIENKKFDWVKIVFSELF